MKNLALLFFLIMIACSSPNPDKVPPNVTQPDNQNLCNPDQIPPVPLEIKFYWSANKEVCKDSFIRACANFNRFNITCAETTDYLSADLVIKSQYAYYDGCRQNAEIIMPTTHLNHYGIMVYQACLPKTDRLSWLTDVFTNKLGELFGVDTYPAFCGGGSFGSAVNFSEYNKPYYCGLTDNDLIAWDERDNTAAIFRQEKTDPSCLPDTSTIPVICAKPTDVDDNFTVTVYADEKIANEALYACNLWNLFGVTCIPSNQEMAFIVVNKNPTDRCLQPGKTEFNFVTFKWEITVSGCLDPDKIITQITHQIGHVFGLPHVPDWCAAAIMNPVPNAECLTWADYGVWHERVPDLYTTYK